MLNRWMILALFLGLSASSAVAGEPMRFVYHGDPAVNPERNAYAWRVLGAALKHTRDRYGDYSMAASAVIDERPNAASLLTGEGGIDISVFTPHAGYEEKLIPVRIPIDRGVLGYRILLVRAADQPKFDRVTKLDDLRAVKFGSLAAWIDTPIMREGGLTVVTGESFDGLFKMLGARRFDALSRGAGEVERDFEGRRRDLPGIVIERSLALHYPMPVYFWFRKDPEGQRMAERVTLGLEEMLADGSFDKLFHQEFDPLLGRLDLAHRHIVELPNPLLSPDEPLADHRLWYMPKP